METERVTFPKIPTFQKYHKNCDFLTLELQSFLPPIRFLILTKKSVGSLGPLFLSFVRKHSLSRLELTGAQNTLSICICASCTAHLAALQFDPELERGNAPGKS